MASTVQPRGLSEITNKMTRFIPDQKLSDTIKALMNTNDDVRLDGAKDVLKIVENSKDEWKEKCTNYTLTRLVRGMASNNKMGRAGYAVALTQILRWYPSIDMNQLLEVVDKELKIRADDGKKEQGQTIIGRVITYMALIQSKRLIQASKEDVQSAVDGIKTLMTKRSYVEHICSYALAEVISQVSSEMFAEVVFPALEEDLKCGWSQCTPNRLLLILRASHHQTKMMKSKFMRQHWDHEKLINEKTMSNVVELLMQSTSLHPVIHPVCTEVLHLLLPDNEHLNLFWSQLVTDKFLTLTANKRYLVYILLDEAMTSSSTMTSSRLKVLLSSHMLTSMMKTLSDKNNLCCTVALKALNSLCKMVKESEGELRLWLIQTLITHPGSILFDSITRTSTVTELVHSLSLKEAQLYFHQCLKYLHCDKAIESSSLSRDECQRWSIHQLSVLANIPCLVSHPLRFDIFKLLFLHSHFTVQTSSKEILHCGKGKVEMSEKCVTQVQTVFRKSIASITSAPREGVQGDLAAKLHFPVLLDLVDYVQKLMENDDIVQLRGTNADQLREAWKKLKSTITSMNAKKSKSMEESAFLHLYLQLGLHLFSDVKGMVDVLEDLEECYLTMNIKKRHSVNKKKDTEPEWVEVMTDLFLGLLSGSSVLVRKIVLVSYGLLASNATEASVKQILEVLTSDESEDDVVEFKDDSDSDEDEEMNSEVEADDEEEEDEEQDNKDNNDSDEDSSDSDGEDEEDVDEELKNALKKALGPAAAASDDEDDDEASEGDLSDSEMFKLDEALGKAFKSHLNTKRKTEQDRRLQLMHFKLKVLDLLGITIKHCRFTESVFLDIMTALVELLCQSSKQKDQRTLVSKTGGLLHNLQNLCRRKKVNIDHDNRDVTRTVDTIKHLMKSAHKEVSVSVEIKMACSTLVGMCHTDDSGAASTKSKPTGSTTKDLCNSVITTLQQCLLDYLYKREKQIDPTLFIKLFTHQARFMAPILVSLVDVVNDTDVNIFHRSQACTMLHCGMNGTTLHESSVDWKTFSERLLAELEEALPKRDEEIKLRFLQVTLLCLHKLDTYFVNYLTEDDLLRQKKYLAEVLPTIIKNKHKDAKKACAQLSQTLKRLTKASASNSTSNSPSKKARKRKSDDVSTDVTSYSTVVPGTPDSADVTAKRMRRKSGNNSTDITATPDSDKVAPKQMRRKSRQNMD